MDNETEDFDARVLPYLEMMRQFLVGDLPLEEFVIKYQERYLKDPTHWPDEYFEELDSVFATGEELDTDANPHEVSEFSTSPAELVAHVTRAIETFERLKHET